jgi:hypothetical protein
LILSFDASQAIPNLMGTLTSADALKLAYDLAAGARAKWINLAKGDNQYGKHWRYEYITGIKPVEEHNGDVVVTLEGEVPHMLENGTKTIDMRDWLLGPKVPVAPLGQKGKRLSKSGGYYRAIPIRHMTPGTQAAPRGKTFGYEMGTPYEGSVPNAKKLQKQVYGAAKQLGATTSEPYKGGGYGGRLITGPTKPPTMRKGDAYGGNIPKLKPHHSTDIYSGMIRKEKTYEKSAQSSYMTFRTISTDVGVGVKWMLKPIPARNYAKRVQDFVESIAAKAAEKYVKGKGL